MLPFAVCFLPDAVTLQSLTFTQHNAQTQARDILSFTMARSGVEGFTQAVVAATVAEGMHCVVENAGTVSVVLRLFAICWALAWLVGCVEFFCLAAYLAQSRKRSLSVCRSVCCVCQGNLCLCVVIVYLLRCCAVLWVVTFASPLALTTLLCFLISVRVLCLVPVVVARTECLCLRLSAFGVWLLKLRLF